MINDGTSVALVLLGVTKTNDLSSEHLLQTRLKKPLLSVIPPGICQNRITCCLTVPLVNFCAIKTNRFYAKSISRLPTAATSNRNRSQLHPGETYPMVGMLFELTKTDQPLFAPLGNVGKRETDWLALCPNNWAPYHQPSIPRTRIVLCAINWAPYHVDHGRIGYIAKP